MDSDHLMLIFLSKSLVMILNFQHKELFNRLLIKLSWKVSNTLREHKNTLRNSYFWLKKIKLAYFWIALVHRSIREDIEKKLDSPL